MYLCIYVYMYICTFFTYIYICNYLYIFIYIYVYMYIYIDISIYIYISACLLFRFITVFTLLRRYAETLYNGDTPLRWNLTRAATPLRRNVCSTPLRRYAETLSAPIRRNLVLRQNADTPKPRITPIADSRNLVLRR